MELQQMIENMSFELYEKLLLAVEIGKWQNGKMLTEEQRESTLQLVMLYQVKHLEQNDHLTISSEGRINELSKGQLKQQFNGETIAEFKDID